MKATDQSSAFEHNQTTELLQTEANGNMALDQQLKARSEDAISDVELRRFLKLMMAGHKPV